MLRSLEAFLFQMNRDNGGNSIDLILVGKCLLSLSDYTKEEIILSMNLINGFGARGYSICGRHLPLVLLTYWSVMYKLKGSTLYLKSGANNTIYFLFTQFGAS